jgi:LysR family transcriptional regulator, glycine cleavage system transcriptional activator
MPRVNRKDVSVLRSLQYFEAVARHLSMKQAAASLGVSQSAVSHQLREFSSAIGQQLLVKSGRGIALTPAGARLAARLGEAFAGLEGIVREFSQQGTGLLQLAVCSSSGPGWLIERLGEFQARHPHIDLQLRLYAQDPLASGEVADAYVIAEPARSGYESISLRDEMLVAVASPTNCTGQQALITTEIAPGHIGEDWIAFCSAAGLKLPAIKRGEFRQCSHYLLALEMARTGQGVALVPDFLAGREIRAGSLALYAKTQMPSGRTYRLCFRQGRAHEPKIMALTEWFRSEIACPAATRARA